MSVPRQRRSDYITHTCHIAEVLRTTHHSKEICDKLKTTQTSKNIPFYLIWFYSNAHYFQSTFLHVHLVRASGATQQLWLLRIISSFFLSSKKLSIVAVRDVCLFVCLSVRLTIFWQIHMYASELFKIYINLLHHAITQ